MVVDTFVELAESVLVYGIGVIGIAVTIYAYLTAPKLPGGKRKR